jgi:hypothetical protein
MPITSARISIAKIYPSHTIGPQNAPSVFEDLHHLIDIFDN